MAINFKTIPHEEQRYDTVGDYFKGDDNIWEFRVSKMENENYEFLVFIHELVEWYLTQKKGITEESISEFDDKFEELRKKYPEVIGKQEPGHMVSAPYHDEHVFAESVERLVAGKLGVDWKKYDEVVNNL